MHRFGATNFSFRSASPARLFRCPPLGWLLAAGLLGAMAGCGPTRAGPVDEQQARQILVETLDGWKAGNTPESFAERQPPIIVQDMDWKKGWTLTDYTIREPGEVADANLLAEVDLTLQSPEGQPEKKTVTYIVGTDPTLTVFRQIF